MPLLEVEDLSVDFRGGGGNVVHAVNTISFDIGKAETVALVGESDVSRRLQVARWAGAPTRAERTKGFALRPFALVTFIWASK